MRPIIPGRCPWAYAHRVAMAKAERCRPEADGTVVVAADTVVALDGDVLGKAADREEAIAMLLRLQGRTHTVHTAVVVRAVGGTTLSRTVSAEVRFRPLARADAERYVDTGESVDKAGAYAIQGVGGALVAAMQGSYTTVVGLPLEETLSMIELVQVGERADG